MNIFYEGKVKETGKQPKRSGEKKIGLQIQQAFYNLKQANEKYWNK